MALGALLHGCLDTMPHETQRLRAEVLAYGDRINVDAMAPRVRELTTALSVGLLTGAAIVGWSDRQSESRRRNPAQVAPTFEAMA